ncbi:MAG: 16S rRNA (guanine(966)-N(2))-methyltransferase RsmD [Terracidiphilus sp.]
MRIIAGRFGSRPLLAPAGLATRPTTDRLRETLFNVLAPRIRGASFLDLYSGSGAVGIEALSRGAAHVVFVERAPAALKILRANLASLGIAEAIQIRASGVAQFLRRPPSAPSKAQPAPFNLVFLDPPYDAAQEYAAALTLLGGAASTLLAPHAQVIAEHRRKHPLEEHYAALTRTRLLEQGDAALSFFELVR